MPPGVSTRVSPVTHGFDARIGPLRGQVCHWLIVSSYCTPGSAQRQAANEICSHNSRALSFLVIFPLVLPKSGHSPSSSTAFKNRFGIRTELFEFCPETV